VTEYKLECRYGATTGHAVIGAYVPTDAEMLAFLVDRHEREEGCGCARALARVRAGDFQLRRRAP